MNEKGVKDDHQKIEADFQEKYLFFSSLELIEYFCNNLAEKDIATQTKRIFEMARVYMRKKDYVLEDVYSLLVMVKDMEHRAVINHIFQLYFKEGSYPVRVIIQISDLEGTADVEIEFCAFRGQKKFINTQKGHLPSGPFSQGVVIEDYVHCSGVRPLNPATQKIVDGDFKQQVKQCLENLNVILEEAGSNLQQAYSFMVYLKDLDLIGDVEAVFAEHFTEDDNVFKEVTHIDELNEGHLLEVSCSAYTGNNKK